MKTWLIVVDAGGGGVGEDGAGVHIALDAGGGEGATD